MPYSGKELHTKCAISVDEFAKSHRSYPAQSGLPANATRAQHFATIGTNQDGALSVKSWKTEAHYPMYRNDCVQDCSPNRRTSPKLAQDTQACAGATATPYKVPNGEYLMKSRHVFSTPDIATARKVVAAVRAVGISDEDVSLIARSDIEMEKIPDKQLDASTDFVPAAMRGIGGGGAVGLVAGIAAVAVPAVGITIAGVGLITLLGAAIGGWSTALAGSSFPNEVRQRFESEIESGHVLVVVDAASSLLPSVDDACVRAGATQLPFEHLSMLQ